MGNSQTCGFGVLNKSSLNEVNVGLSMGVTHKFENGLRNGEIFYRWPGAVHYTVFVFARNHDSSNDLRYLQMAVPESVTYCERKACYGGGSGTWLIVEGGPCQNEQGLIRTNPLTLRKATKEEVFENGTFSRYSHGLYHTTPQLLCTPNCPWCKRD